MEKLTKNQLREEIAKHQKEINELQVRLEKVDAGVEAENIINNLLILAHSGDFYNPVFKARVTKDLDELKSALITLIRAAKYSDEHKEFKIPKKMLPKELQPVDWINKSWEQQYPQFYENIKFEQPVVGISFPKPRHLSYDERQLLKAFNNKDRI